MIMPSSTAASTAAAIPATSTTVAPTTNTNIATKNTSATTNKMTTPTTNYNSRTNNNNSITASNTSTTSTTSTIATTTTTPATRSTSAAHCSTQSAATSLSTTSLSSSSTNAKSNANLTLSHNKPGSSTGSSISPSVAPAAVKKVVASNPQASNIHSMAATASVTNTASQSIGSITVAQDTTSTTNVAQSGSSTRGSNTAGDGKSAVDSQQVPLNTISSPSRNNKTATTASSTAYSNVTDIGSNSQNNAANNSVILLNAPKTSKISVVNGSLSSDHSRASTDGHRTPNVDNISKTNLYIKGLQTTTNDQDLFEMCARFGQISSTKAIIDKGTGCCRGYGFVEFTSPQAAECAVQELTKEGIQAQMAKISPSYSTHSNSNSHHHHHHSHHHNQYHNVNRGQVHHHHNSHHGHGNSSNNNSSNSGGAIASNSSTSHHHSSGYSANSAYQHNQNSSHGTSSGNNTSGHHNNPDPTNLYIANLPPNMSEQELENLLSSYGPVVSTRILRDQNTNIPRGVGFARMESRDKCEQIIEQLNGRPCKGCQEPLLVKFADGGNKKRNYHNNLHHHNSSHHRTQKSHQDETRWRENTAPAELGSIPSFEHQGNISHSNHLTDLAMMGPMTYHARMPIFPPAMQAGSGYPNPLGPQANAPQWIHSSGHSQPYVIPQPIIPPGGLTSSNQAATAAAMQYGHHIPQLTSQMQGLQIAHPGAPVAGYLTPQHQWSQP